MTKRGIPLLCFSVFTAGVIMTLPLRSLFTTDNVMLFITALLAMVASVRAIDDGKNGELCDQ